MPGGRNDKRRDSDSGVGDGGGADRAGSADGVDEGPMVEETDDEAARMSPGRLEAFSDGVIAIRHAGGNHHAINRRAVLAGALD